ncbi:MAG: hypothetical protein RIR51_46 [Bacteroidota bacterium]
MEKIQLEVKQLSASYGPINFLRGINFTIKENEIWAILGPVGSGKTSLAKALCGRMFRKGEVVWNLGKENPHIILLEQQSIIRNRSNTTEFYFQQRFNAHDQEDAYTIEELLSGEDSAKVKFWLEKFSLEDKRNRPTLQMSNGENKRLQLIQALLKNPDFIILDNPYLGLDNKGRELLTRALEMARKEGISFILIHSNDVIPEFISHVLVLEKGEIDFVGLKSAYKKKENFIEFKKGLLDELIQSRKKFEDFEVAVKMEEATIRYKEKIILDKISWEMKRGEAWHLKGPNGSGKSTLLSMITADNPQSYSQKLWLFDRRRGSGESIWEIKKKIGFVSPELHLYFKSQISCLSVVGSGILDSLGLFKELTEEQKVRSRKWMEVLGVEHLTDKRFNQVSLGEQKLVLIARALVKNPPLVILDEPGQGLAEREIHHLKRIMNYLIEHSQVSLIYVSHYQEDIPEKVDKILQL